MRRSASATGAPASALPTAQWKPLEIAFWLLPVAAYFVFPRYLTLGSQIFIAALFALSLDLIMGYARIISLGHAAFFGIGAYTAGLLARHGWGEPLSGLAAAAAAAAAVGLLTSFLVVRGQDLTRLMVTLGIGLMLYEAANQASSITGGVDGLSGVEMNKLFGVFGFGLNGKTGVLVLPGRSFPRVLFRPYAGAISVRAEPARHSRRRAADARDRGVGAAQADRDLHDRRWDSGDRRGPAGANNAVRRHRFAGISRVRRNW